MISGRDVWESLLKQVSTEEAEEADEALEGATKPFIENFVASLSADDEAMVVTPLSLASMRVRFITYLLENGYAEAAVASMTDEVVSEFKLTRPEIVVWGNRELEVDRLRNGIVDLMQPYVAKAHSQGLTTMGDVLLVNPAIIFTID